MEISAAENVRSGYREAPSCRLGATQSIWYSLRRNPLALAFADIRFVWICPPLLKFLGAHLSSSWTPSFPWHLLVLRCCPRVLDHLCTPPLYTNQHESKASACALTRRVTFLREGVQPVLDCKEHGGLGCRGLDIGRHFLDLVTEFLQRVFLRARSRRDTSRAFRTCTHLPDSVMW